MHITKASHVYITANNMLQESTITNCTWEANSLAKQIKSRNHMVGFILFAKNFGLKVKASLNHSLGRRKWQYNRNIL
jgi:hypothetical protein